MLVMPEYYKAYRTPSDVAEYLNSRGFSKFENEHFILVLMGSDYSILSAEDLFQGSENRCAVSSRVLAKRILESNCAGFMVSHNHPNGSIKASKYDDELTRVVSIMGQSIGVKFLDHIITTPSGMYHSYLEESSPCLEDDYLTKIIKVAEEV